MLYNIYLIYSRTLHCASVYYTVRKINAFRVRERGEREIWQLLFNHSAHTHTHTHMTTIVCTRRSQIAYMYLRKRLARPKGHRTVCCRVKDIKHRCCRCRCGFQWSHIADVATRTLTLPPVPQPPPPSPQLSPSHLNLRYPPSSHHHPPLLLL